MPTITAHCQSEWLPTGVTSGTGKPGIVFKMAELLTSCLADIINEVDHRSLSRKILTSSVWANFVPMSDVAINSADVLFLVNPPEIELTFGMDRNYRRRILGQRLLDHLQEHFVSQQPLGTLPHWELEVIPVASSGFGVYPAGSVGYKW